MERQIKAPLTKGVAKTPVVMQMEALECGAACLTMVLAYYEKWVPLEQIRADCGVSRDGSNAKNVLRAARSYGLTAKGYRYEPEALIEKGKFPCVIHWNFNHFVVLKGFRRGKAYLNDPAKGSVTVSMEEFDAAFTGICMMFEPGEGFQPGGSPKGMLTYAQKRLRGMKGAIGFVAAASMLVSLIGMVQPVFSRVFTDRLLTGQDPRWLWPFTLLLSGATILWLLAAGLKDFFAYRLAGKLAAVGRSTFLWKVLQMPMEFFSQRMAGDIQDRQETNGQIANTLVNILAPLAFDSLSMVFYLAVMLRYSVPLALTGVASVAVNLVLSNIISQKRVNITRVQLRDAGRLSGSTASGIDMIETIKASGAESGFFKKWSGYQASVNTQQVRFAKLDQYLGTVPKIVSSLTSTCVMSLGVYLTMQGSFTVGMLMAFQGFLSAFTRPAGTLVSAGQTLQEMRSQMERVEDVMEYPSDVSFREGAGEEGGGKLSGRLEMKHITFGYSRLGEPLIEDFNLSLRPGSHVAFVGGSGCGKSTLSKLISGLYQPWSGEILFDGKPLSQISRGVFTGSLAVVDQDIILFEDTIANNIKMWDESIEDFEMILAARDANLHDDIMQREGGYQYRVTEGGKDFSGGQRQRLEIARVLAQDPTIVILDEATSALDAKTEYEVVKAIKERGITCVVIAHRLSTIRDCDEILVLDHGKVVERGKHEDLYAKGGVYTQLVTNE